MHFRNAHSIRAYMTLMRHCNQLQFGGRFWVIPLLVLLYPIIQALLLKFNIMTDGYSAADLQNNLIGIPIYILAIGLGVGIVAREIENRTLEISMLVPGGIARTCRDKLVAAIFLILPGILSLALLMLLFFGTFAPDILVRVFQGSVFFLVLGMGAGALFKNTVVASLVCLVIFILNLNFTSSIWSPLFNPLELSPDSTPELWRLLLQNHVIVLFVITIVTVLTFMRTEQLEVLLKDF